MYLHFRTFSDTTKTYRTLASFKNTRVKVKIGKILLRGVQVNTQVFGKVILYSQLF
jgi:hypothetical protein